MAIDGRLEWHEWETSDQQKRQAVNVVGQSVQFLDTPAGAERHAGDIPGGDGAPEDRESVSVGGGSGEELVF